MVPYPQALPVCYPCLVMADNVYAPVAAASIENYVFKIAVVIA